VLLALHLGASGGSALAVSALFICLWGPVVALGGVAGKIVDRHENRRLLIGVSIAQAAVVAAIAVSTSSLGALLVLAALLGAGVAAPRGVRADPGGGRRGPRGRSERPRRGGALHRADRGAAARRRARGGGSTRLGLLLDGASFAAVAAAAVALHARHDPRAAVRDDADGDVRGGVAALLADRTLAIAPRWSRLPARRSRWRSRAPSRSASRSPRCC